MSSRRGSKGLSTPSGSASKPTTRSTARVKHILGEEEDNGNNTFGLTQSIQLKLSYVGQEFQQSPKHPRRPPEESGVVGSFLHTLQPELTDTVSSPSETDDEYDEDRSGTQSQYMTGGPKLAPGKEMPLELLKHDQDVFPKGTNAVDDVSGQEAHDESAMDITSGLPNPSTPLSTSDIKQSENVIITPGEISSIIQHLSLLSKQQGEIVAAQINLNARMSAIETNIHKIMTDILSMKSAYTPSRPDRITMERASALY